MKTQLSSLDMHFLLSELKDLEGSKADKIYISGKEEVYIQFYKSNVGKKILRIIVGKAIFISDVKNADETPSGFCMMLRKNLEGKFLDSIWQLESERILKLVFKAKDEAKTLYMEFFGKGNLILCNEEDVISDSLTRQKFKDRSILPKEKYKYPNMAYNFFNLKNNQLADLLKNSEKDKIVTCLAVELGLGGNYSEEVCLLSSISKDTSPKKINNDGISKIITSIKKIINSKKNPQIVYKDKEAIDSIPADLELYNGYEKKKFSGFNEALDTYFTKELKIVKKEETISTKKIEELKRIIEEQKLTMESMEKKENENRKKAEIIYNNYQLIKEILDEINKASKRYSWEEIKKKLKGHKIVKEVNLKDKTVVVDIL